MARNATEAEKTLGRRGGRKLVAKEFNVTQEDIPAEQKLAEPAMGGKRAGAAGGGEHAEPAVGGKLQPFAQARAMLKGE